MLPGCYYIFYILYIRHIQINVLIILHGVQSLGVIYCCYILHTHTRRNTYLIYETIYFVYILTFYNDDDDDDDDYSRLYYYSIVPRERIIYKENRR